MIGTCRVFMAFAGETEAVFLPCASSDKWTGGNGQHLLQGGCGTTPKTERKCRQHFSGFARRSPAARRRWCCSLPLLSGPSSEIKSIGSLICFNCRARARVLVLPSVPVEFQGAAHENTNLPIQRIGRRQAHADCYIAAEQKLPG